MPKGNLCSLMLLLVSATPPSAWAGTDDVFVNPDFRVRDGRLWQVNDQVKAIHSGQGELETYQAKSKAPRDIGFFHVAISNSLKTGQPARTFEFYKPDQSGIQSSTASYDNQGKLTSYARCDQWTGCVTVNKLVCDQVAESMRGGYSGPEGSFSKVTDKKIKECGAIIGHMARIPALGGSEYQSQAKNNYDALYQYMRKALPGDGMSDFFANLQRLSLDDRGQFIPHSLKENRSKDYAEPWHSGDTIQGLMNIYATCVEKGHLLNANQIRSAEEPKGFGAAPAK